MVKGDNCNTCNYLKKGRFDYEPDGCEIAKDTDEEFRDQFVCDFYDRKRSGSFRRKYAKLKENKQCRNKKQ